jgi:protein-S-isoprenylcysteine O-methyltransferase Ste14
VNDNAGVIAYPPYIVAAFSLLGLGLHLWLGYRIASWPVSLGAGAVAGLASARLAIAAERQLIAAGTAVRPSGSTSTIVRAGPYSLTRNPLYIAQGLLMLMFALLLNSLTMLAMVVPWWLVTHFGVVRREERYLTRKFGERYLAYKRDVRRWI